MDVSTTPSDHAADAHARADALETAGRHLEAIEILSAANRRQPDASIERRLVRMRRDAFVELRQPVPPPPWPPAVPADPVGAGAGPPEITPAELSVERLRNGILGHGSLLVRGLLSPARVVRLREAIDRAFDAYDASAAGRALPGTAAWYDPIDGIANPEFSRDWGREGGAVFAADSPRALFEFMETVRELGIDRLLADHFGERPTLSVEKCTLRRIDARRWKTRLANWHQDGSFLGKGIRTVDVWFSLSHCGRDAPGMEIVPRRIEHILGTGDDKAHFDWTVSLETIEKAMPGVPIWRPEFAPGDVMFFDERCLHRTCAELGMPYSRYAIESWFFASSVYPTDTSTPLVV